MTHHGRGVYQQLLQTLRLRRETAWQLWLWYDGSGAGSNLLRAPARGLTYHGCGVYQQILQTLLLRRETARWLWLRVGYNGDRCDMRVYV